MIKLNDKLKKIILYFAILFISILISISTFENGILLSILSMIIIYLFVDKVKIKNYVLFLFMLNLIIKVLSVLIINIPIKVDYLEMYNATLKALNNDLSFFKKEYFIDYNYQSFHVFYQSLIFKIFGTRIIILKVLNCIYSSVICVFIYKFSKIISCEKVSRFISLLYSISLYPLYLNSVLGNQQLSLMLILIGVWIAIEKKDNIKYLLLSGIILGIGNLERGEGIIYLLTLGIFFFISSKKITHFLKKFAPIFLAYVIIITSANLILITTNINKNGFKNTNPYWKFVVGLNYESDGKYNEKDKIKYIRDKDKEIKKIKERITNIKKIPLLFYKKIKILYFYSGIEEGKTAQNNNQLNSILKSTFINYMKTINLLVIIICFIGQIRKHKIKELENFFTINFIIYFFIYLLIEVDARYYYNIQVSIIILSSIGIEYLIKLLENKKRNNY